MRTLRARLLLGTALGTALILTVFSFALYGVVRTALWSEFDDGVAAKARSLAALVEQEGDKVELEFDEESLPAFAPSEHAEYYQFRLSDGSVLARSSSLAGRDLDRISGSIAAPAYRTVKLPDGRPGRISGITFFPRQEEGGSQKEHFNQSACDPVEVTLVVGRETAGIEQTLGQLRVLLTGGCATAALVSVGVLAWFVGHGLKPVGQLAMQIAEVGESDLTTRIGSTNCPAELMPIVDRLNDLLARLDRAFTREKTLTADVAHELRTPLAGLRSTLEVALSRPREAGVYRQAMVDGLAIISQTQAMVNNLLCLARLEAGQLSIKREPVSLEDLLHACWQPFADQARERSLRVDWDVDGRCILQTDREMLSRVLHNVFENAVTYADPNGTIRIECTSRTGGFALRVSNTCGELPVNDVEHLFDRFRRGNRSRSEPGRRCGLGLPLCRRIAAVLGGSLSAESTSAGVFRIVLAFPTIV